ncbi:ATP-binding protein [Paenibacillus thalictri]|uniref:histidine kinase n=1 Tax=Paenibacillus thalictri TaxID=2527873 RepID=A0A4Q9DUV8_9BACL|nr:ATP-binding protein [Paenibacillus thalictri]TBL78570.1 response regulator [Paenibacillus thalictri]
MPTFSNIFKLNSTFRAFVPYRYLLMCVLLIGLLAGLRIGWNQVLFPLDSDFHPVNGVADLRGVNLEQVGPLSLEGQWEWYPNRLLTQQYPLREASEAALLQVPGNWKPWLHSENGNAYGYGTYRLRVKVDPLKQPVSFWFKGIQAAAEVEVNGNVLGGSGRVGLTKQTYEPSNRSFDVVYSEKGATEIELLVRVANFDSPYTGGITSSVRFGTEKSLNALSGYSIGFQLMIILIMLLHGLYACIVYLYRPSDWSLFVTGLIYILVGLAVSTGHDKTLLLFLPVNYAWTLKLRLIVMLWQNLCVLLMYRKFSESLQGGLLLRVYISAIVILTALIALSPASVANSLLDTNVYIFVYSVPFLWFVWVTGVMAVRRLGEKDLHLLLVTAVCIISNLTWNNVDTFMTLTNVYYPFDLTLALIVFSVYWFKKYLRNSDEISELYEQLKIADKLKDRFLANTAHELRTPLHGIMNITGNVYAREKVKLEDISRKEMELVGTVSRRMSLLLDDLLDIARLQEHRIVLRLESLYVQAVVPGVMAMLTYMTDGKPVELRMNIQESLPPVMADEKRLVQIFYNLLHNALKYTERGTISISAEEKAGQVEIRITDTGVGMDEQTRSRIFAPYVQGEYGINDGRGLGLGLSICKQLVELHGGEIEVESALGRGSTFRFCLPLAGALQSSQPPEKVLSEQGAAVVAGLPTDDVIRFPVSAADQQLLHYSFQQLLGDNPVRILAVDDDPVNLNVLAGILSAEPFHVTRALSGQEALDLLDTENWDLLIADVMMPRMSGYELTKKVRERYSVSELPVLLLTARSQLADIYTGFLAGANDYITKPADALELRYRIRALIALKQSIHDRLRIEAAYLQAQIQPHFLFNTLNSLLVLSEIDTEEMHKLGEAFAAFLRISFDYLNTGDTVELEHELELVEAYLYIEKERFMDKLQIIWKVEPGIKLQLPPLSIQPLVENAVKHGIMSRAAGGTIRLGIVRTEGGVLIEIKDNGVGITEDKVARLLNPTRKERTGVGIANTNRRLIQLYGQGLSIDSTPDKGTTVSFTVPVK